MLDSLAESTLLCQQGVLCYFDMCQLCKKSLNNQPVNVIIVGLSDHASSGNVFFLLLFFWGDVTNRIKGIN